MAKQDNNNARFKALEDTLSRIHKQYGSGAIMRLGDASANMNIDTISTGSLSLDMATGVGGVPVESPHSSMQSMLWIQSTHGTLVST